MLAQPFSVGLLAVVEDVLPVAMLGVPQKTYCLPNTSRTTRIRSGSERSLRSTSPSIVGALGQNEVVAYPYERWLRDLTFGAHTGLSVLMGLADEETSAHIVTAHEGAVAQALQLLNSGASAARVGVRDLESRGLRTAIEHHLVSTEGNSWLHSHLLVSSHVELLDGGLVPVDRQLLDSVWEAAQVTYLAYLESLVQDAINITFEDRGRGRAVVGIDPRLEATFLPTRCHRGIEQHIAKWRA